MITRGLGRLTAFSCAMAFAVTTQAVQFTVDDGFAGSGLLDLSVNVDNAEGFTWMGPVTWDTAPFSGVGRLPDGATWTGGGIAHAGFNFYTDHGDGRQFNLWLTLTGNGGTDWATEMLTYRVYDFTTAFVEPTIWISRSGQPNFAFFGVDSQQFDRGGNADLEYLLAEASRYSSTIPDTSGMAVTSIFGMLLGTLCLIRPRAKNLRSG
jgi:hypothetical protein